MKLLFVIIFISISIKGAISEIIPRIDATEQILTLLNDSEFYNKNVIPFQKKSGPLPVTSTVYLRHADLDDSNMRATVDLTFRLTWEDNRLSYVAPDVAEVRFSDVTKFWIPDVFFKNSLNTQQMTSIFPESYISVNSTGKITYSGRFVLTLRCEMNFERFPHDTQLCPIVVATYGYTNKDIQLHFHDEPLSFNKDLVFWNRFYLDTVSTMSFNSSTATGEYSSLKIEIKVHRFFGSYLLEWYTPCVSLVIIAFLSEILDHSALLPRLILTIGPLLTLTAVSLTYSSGLTSVPYIKAIDVFTGMSLLAIFATVLHILLSYYFSVKPEEEAKPEDASGTTKWKSFCGKLKEKGNFFAKCIIIGGYFSFIFFYCLAYLP